MKYNEKYKRWFTKGGLVYRYSKSQDKLVLCKQTTLNDGYKQFCDSKGKMFSVHRAIYETFVGEIPQGYQIDHINTIRDDNRLENLRAVTPKENMSNPLTKKHMRISNKIDTKQIVDLVISILNTFGIDIQQIQSSTKESIDGF